MTAASSSHGTSVSPTGPVRGTMSPPATIALPKNRSTGNLLGDSALHPFAMRPRGSADGGRPLDFENMPRSPILAEHEHGLVTSGLRRIRQNPAASRVATMPSSPEASFMAPARSASMILPTPRSFGAGGSASPSVNFGEDLTRFPSESLHSFSFAHQSEDLLHHRQNVIRMSIDFMRDRSAWAVNNPGLVNAQAKVSGDAEMQSMMELLARADLLNADAAPGGGLGLRGPVTGPANVDDENVFEKQFAPRRASPADSASPTSLPYSSPREPPPQMQLGDSSVAKSAQESTDRVSLKRTYTDTTPLTLQTRLSEALSRPYLARDLHAGSGGGGLLSPSIAPSLGRPLSAYQSGNHGQRWAPAAQAIFTTSAAAPWTILAANDLACLVFGVTRAEVRKLGILEVVREDRRKWLEEKLGGEGTAPKPRAPPPPKPQGQKPASHLSMRGGITALLLSKPPSRHSANSKAQTDGGSGSQPGHDGTKRPGAGPNHQPSRSRGVLLCGDVVPIQKRNGSTGSASLWVKEKKGGLIWVVEEIVEDLASVTLDEVGKVLSASGCVSAIWGEHARLERREIRKLLPRLPMTSGNVRTVDYSAIRKTQHYTAKNPDGYNVPVSISTNPSLGELHISSFPHIAGMLVLSSSTLRITSSNSVFSAALFGYRDANKLHITDLVPQFAKLLYLLQELDDVELVDGLVISEQSFRRARAILAHRDGNADAAEIFLRPSGLQAVHRDGSELNVDVQMRVVQSSTGAAERQEPDAEEDEDDEDEDDEAGEVVLALWVTYSRSIHSVVRPGTDASPLASRPSSPPRQPSPGQSVTLVEPPVEEAGSMSPSALLSEKIKEATMEPISRQATIEIQHDPPADTPPRKKVVGDFTVLEEMGQGAYGQVKLARHNRSGAKVVLKYVTKKRILVDTWTRDRKLGTVPLEIHVLNYLKRDGLRHANIVEMLDFFEDQTNYYIEMVPHGLPGLDLFDYIEMRATMDEDECRHIFLQVADALHHLHTKALVVHRDIKDENIILDQENKVKLVDFGSAAYIKNGPFDVFVGTIDYAAPEVLQGNKYGGREQDVWALGILLYTLVYKENPFYNVDEILDHELRVPWVLSEGSIDLIRAMLNRDVAQRFTIEQVMQHPWCAEAGG